MANYNLVVDSKFDPFTYQELLHPVMTATQAHQQLEDAYGELSTKANIWENLANEQTDPKAYKMYKSYANDLANQADQLAREGLNPSSRQKMLNMKARYASDITPIEQAYARRKELADEQRKALAANPTMLYQRMANTMSLDEFLNNPQADYGQSYSGALLTQQVANAAANIAKEARDSEEGRRKLRQILPYQYELIRQNGFSRDAVMKAIMSDPNADKILTGLVDNAITMSGVNNWGDDLTRQKALDYARQGLYSAIGQTDYNMVTDQAGLSRYQHSLTHPDTSDALARNRGNIPIDINRLVSPNATGEDAVKAAKEAKKFFNLTDGQSAYRKIDLGSGEGAVVSGGVGVVTGKTSSIATNKDGSHKFDIWHKNGKMLTRHQFAQQGKTSEDRAALASFYDTQVAKHASSLGINISDLAKQGKVPTVSGTQFNRRNISASSGPLAMEALRVKFKDDSKVLQKLLPTLTVNEDESLIQEIESFDNKGTIKNSGKIVKADTFVDDEGKLKGTPAFFAPPNENVNGIIMKFKGKDYLIPNERLGSLSNQAYKVDVPALKKAQQQKQFLINTYGEDAYYSSQVGRAIEQIIDNSGASYLRTIYNTLGWEADAPSYDVNITSPTQIP